MERVQITKDLSYSRLNMGMLKLKDFGMADTELVDFFERLADMGITTLDFADHYGDGLSEEIFGRVLRLQPSLRNRVEINTKCGNIAVKVGPIWLTRYYDISYKNIISAFEGSLRRLGVDAVDTLTLHRIDHLTPFEEIVRALEELRRAGKVRYFGASNYLPIHLDALLHFFPDIVVNQMRFSCYDIENFENGSAFYAQQKGLALTAYSPVARGYIFTDQSPKTIRLLQTLTQVREELGAPSLDCVCYSFLLAHPAKIMPIIGTTKFARIQEAALALDYQMNRKQWYRIYEASLGDSMP